jgi:uncharacterized protein (TIGR02594 family)
MVVLKLGSRGGEVKRLQLLLNSTLRPSPRLRLDGDFGPATHRAVARVQAMKGLSADGVVGPKTWGVLGQRGEALTQVVNACIAGAPWMEIAALELGIHEDARPLKHNERILRYHESTTLKATADEVPWCSSFVNWAVTQSGFRGTNNALARSWLGWGTHLPAPRVGAVTVIKRRGQTHDRATGSGTGYHVGFLVAASSSHVRLLGGNQGDAVRYSNFALAAYTIEGYRWPT